MPIVETGVALEDVKDNEFELIPSNTYEFQVRDIKQVVTGENSKTPGRPMLVWSIEIVGDPELVGRRLFYNTVLAWENPADPGKVDDSGVGLLAAMVKGVGIPWEGTQMNTDLYLGASGFVKVGQRKYKGNNGDEITSNSTKILPQALGE